MDPVGLAVGILGLAGLFNTCLDVLDKVDDFKSSDADSRALAAIFDAQKIRFERWGKYVGLNHSVLAEAHHRALDEPAIWKGIQQLLISVQDIYQNSDMKVSLQRADTLTTKQAGQQKGRSLPTKPTREYKRDRWQWALRGKTKRIAQVDQLAKLVQSLHDLVPIDDLQIEIGAVVGDTNISNMESRNFEVPTTLDNGDTLEQLLMQLKRENEVATRKAFYNWLLGRHSTSDLYEVSLRKRLEGTCEWIVQNAKFLEWCERDTASKQAKLLWINGPGGFGKTILCGKVIEHLATDKSVPLAYYFISSDYESHNDPFVALRFWVHQLLHQNQAIFDTINEQVDFQDEREATRMDSLHLLKDIITLLPACTLILDGLDESICSQEHMIDFLESVKKAISNSSTHLMITSRDEPDIRTGIYSDCCTGLIVSEHRIQPTDVRNDNASLSRSIVDRKLSKKDNSTKESITQKLTERCKGMFLWLKMQEASLRGGKNRKQLETAIENTPDVPEALYSRNWGRICQLPLLERSRAFSLLRWTAFSVRPLSIREITEALIIDQEYDDLPVEELPDCIDEEYINTEIVELCGSLIEIRHDPTQDLASGTLHLAHFSVKEFLLKELPSISNPASQNEAGQISILVKACLQYIDYPMVWIDSQPEEVQLIGSFRDYAAGSWYQYVQAIQHENPDILSFVNRFFDSNNENWISWKKWYNTMKARDDENYPKQNEAGGPLFHAVLLDLVSTVKYLLVEKGVDANEKINTGQTILEAACSRGDLDIVSCLLHSGASLSMRSIKGRTPLHSAAREGHLAVVKLLIEKGADIMNKQDNGWTPLNVAALGGRLKVVELLLDLGADVTVATDNGWTPIKSASSRGHLEVVKTLLNAGADVTVADENGWSPAISASAGGYAQVMHQLLETGEVDISLKNKDGDSPIILAAYHGHSDIVSLLVNAGADLTDKDEDGWTPIMAAASNGQAGVVKLLLDTGKAGISTTDNDGDTPLNLASYYGYSEVVKLLLGAGADVNVADKDGDTPVISSSYSGNAEVLQLLLATGKADVSHKNLKGDTPMTLASYYGYVEVVELLLAAGADLTATDSGGDTALILASQRGNIEVVKSLLLAGADALAVNDIGQTAINAAAYHGHAAVVKLLLDASEANITIPDKDGWTPLMSASNNGNIEIMKLLLGTGKAGIQLAQTSGWTPLAATASRGHVEAMKLLLEAGADIEAQIETNWTPLNLASSNGFSEIVEILVREGADMATKSIRGTTPLITAAKNGHLEVVKYLVDEGAEMDTPDYSGWTALSEAAAHNHNEIVMLLMQKGADVTTRSASGWTPLLGSSYHGQADTVKTMLNKGADMSATDVAGYTALIRACQKGHTEVVKVLLQEGADITRTNRAGFTPLNEAVTRGNIEIVKILLEHGADITVADSRERTPLQNACRRGHQDVVKLLLNMHRADASINSELRAKCLVMACRNDHTEVVRLLLQTTGVNMEDDVFDLQSALWYTHLNGCSMTEQVFAEDDLSSEEDCYGFERLFSASEVPESLFC